MEDHEGGLETLVAIGLVRRGQEFLVGVREQEPFAGLDEFPGGKCLAGEAPEQCVVREVEEETGLQVGVGGMRAELVHDYPHGRLRLLFFDCTLMEAGEPRPPFRWVGREELATLRFPAANRPVVEALSKPPGA